MWILVAMAAGAWFWLWWMPEGNLPSGTRTGALWIGGVVTLGLLGISIDTTVAVNSARERVRTEAAERLSKQDQLLRQASEENIRDLGGMPGSGSMILPPATPGAALRSESVTPGR
jgi:hypothetical protein